MRSGQCTKLDSCCNLGNLCLDRNAYVFTIMVLFNQSGNCSELAQDL